MKKKKVHPLDYIYKLKKKYGPRIHNLDKTRFWAEKRLEYMHAL